MNKYKDTDLREALQRKYADMPQLPADFMAKMEQRTEAENKQPRFWRWIAVAACFLVVIGMGLHYQFKETSHPIVQSNAPNQSIEHAQLTNRPRSVNQSTTPNQSIEHAQLTNRPRSVDQSTTLDSDPNLHNAAYDLTKDTVPYQDPARVDEFIAKLAEYNEVKAVPLNCSSDKGADTTIVSTAYLFDDRPALASAASSSERPDLFAMLLQVACRYDTKTPGYLLNFSRQQFFFCMKDLRKGLKYLWIAEHIGGKHILLYSTHSPIETEVSSACFQDYREQLTHKGINF